MMAAVVANPDSVPPRCKSRGDFLTIVVSLRGPAFLLFVLIALISVPASAVPPQVEGTGDEESSRGWEMPNEELIAKSGLARPTHPG